MTVEIGGQPVVLPAGWTVEFGQQANQSVNGVTQPGIQVNLVEASTNTTSTVFVPYAAMTSLSAVSGLLNTRINQLLAIRGLSAGT